MTEPKNLCAVSGALTLGSHFAKTLSFWSSQDQACVGGAVAASRPHSIIRLPFQKSVKEPTLNSAQLKFSFDSSHSFSFFSSKITVNVQTNDYSSKGTQSKTHTLFGSSRLELIEPNNSANKKPMKRLEWTVNYIGYLARVVRFVRVMSLGSKTKEREFSGFFLAGSVNQMTRPVCVTHPLWGARTRERDPKRTPLVCACDRGVPRSRFCSPFAC